MNLARRCRPSLAATTVLTALVLGGCSYAPERSLTVTEAAAPAADKATADGKAGKTRTASRDKAAPAKQQHVARAESGKRRMVADTTAKETAAQDTADKETAAKRTASSGYTPSRQLVASNSERDCLVRAMYFESHRSSPEGLLAVGTVVMNRVNSPSYPGTICGVVGQKRQFAPGVLSRSMSARERLHADAMADEILAGKRHAGIGDAMFFHVATRRYKYPNMRYLHVAGGNIFYRKVGRNAPRVVEGSATAYAAATPTLPATPVTVASAEQAVPAPQAQDTPARPAIAAPAVRSAPAAAAPIPTPLPRTALTLPQGLGQNAGGNTQPAAAQPASPALEQLATAPAQSRISYTVPLGANLPPPRNLSTEPSTLLSYRTVGNTGRAD